MGINSYSWSNAGTGHYDFCNLKYIPEQLDGLIKIEKDLDIASAFEVSKHI
ncbi:MAG: malate:quinone oxidoreductase [Bacteroidales bacterium]